MTEQWPNPGGPPGPERPEPRPDSDGRTGAEPGQPVWKGDCGYDYHASGVGHGQPPAYPPYGYSPVPQVPTDQAAIWALVTGILSWTICPLIAGIPAVILGVVARRNIREAAGARQGDGLAIAGLVLGIANIALYGLIAIAFVVIAIVAFAAESR